MAHSVNRLNDKKVKGLTKPGRYCDGGGLYLTITKGNTRSWIFRWRDKATGKLRDYGLGPAWDVSLAEARAKAHTARELVRDGGDPIEARRETIQEKRAIVAARAKAEAQRVTFGECAERYIAANRAGWSNAKHAEQWENTLKTYGTPINALPAAAIDTDMVVACIKPHWADKTETMTRVRQRIEAVLDWATVKGYRSGENPARWKGHLDKLLPKPSKVRKVQHQPALPYVDAPAFMAELRMRNTLAAKCLELQILTATRPGEACGARVDEFDMDAGTWTIPAERMKAGKEHRIPLSAPALRVVRSLDRSGVFLFPGVRGKPITSAATMKLLKELRDGATCHGFRSTFRDWAGETTSHPREVIEHALAHRLKDQAEAAYQRGDLFTRRKALMADWATYCG